MSHSLASYFNHAEIALTSGLEPSLSALDPLEFLKKNTLQLNGVAWLLLFSAMTGIQLWMTSLSLRQVMIRFVFAELMFLTPHDRMPLMQRSSTLRRRSFIREAGLFTGVFSYFSTTRTGET